MSRASDELKDNCFIGCLGLILFFLLGAGVSSCNYALSDKAIADGYRDSTIRKVSESGLFFKTWEVEGLGDGTVKQGDKGITAETFHYSVRNVALIEKIKAIPAGTKVRIHYQKMLTTWSPKGETPYIITDVEAIKCR